MASHAAAAPHGPTGAPAGHDDGHAHHHYTTTGLDNRKIAIWAFLGSECMLFASLISTYLIYKGKSLVGPFPHTEWVNEAGKRFEPILDIPVTSASTAVLLMSSFAMVLALQAVQLKGKPIAATAGWWERIQRSSQFWLAATAFLGATFLGFQAYEFTSFVHEGLTIKTNLFGSTFFTLTGFHGAHVLIGTIMLAVVLARSIRGHFTPTHHFAFEAASWYWHFVDVVWLGLFVTVYLL